MPGLEILSRTLSVAARQDKQGHPWQYNSRSDHHSKVACWCIVFDLLQRSSLLRQHVTAGLVYFGINHEMRDYTNNRKKDLDLVLSTVTPGTIVHGGEALADLVKRYDIQLTSDEKQRLSTLPALTMAPVGSVLMALEAKACMTEHSKARPRLFDELNSSHATVHGATDQAIAAGFVMINAANDFLSPGRNGRIAIDGPVWNRHRQPSATITAIEKVRELPRRSRVGTAGYDALAIAVVSCRNDGSPVPLVTDPPAPQPGDIDHYESLIERLTHIYATRFSHL
ncbi:hypothetical protein [Aurantimonas coralicida]|uniref:hypothetical protein n=1 Tax=Aurantimonas coralicida TaxID=182270 RepID=UPI001E437FA1|nr:hypothetical protein [Aurantimonas coralicida]MCD1644954.1 hypothetical protein [Aurantimonas coralicida]